MEEFLSVLALYYTCDAAAALRPLGPDEVRVCTDAYESVKVWFTEDFELADPGTLARYEQLLDGYREFKAWEAANPEVVGKVEVHAAELARGGVRLEEIRF
ncbi:MAG: hypothetical protein AAFR35_01015 [Pseudomonadota bacterium]